MKTNEEHYAGLLNTLFTNASQEQSLFATLQYLQKEIPFTRAICFVAEREKKLANILVEYIPNAQVTSYTQPLRFITPREELEKDYGENFDKVLWRSKKGDQSAIVKAYYDQLSYTIHSLLSFIAQHHDETFMYVCFCSEHYHAFSQEHLRLITLLKPLISSLVTKLFLENPEPHIFIANAGPLPTTYENQIRACPDMQDIMRKVDAIAATDSTFIIHGPTGSGKELVAETIHALSPRFDKPLVKVNCGAIPESLLEGELFGHEKGAFTGAIQSRKGYFEQAHLGTLFLDEIGELSSQAQLRLLRALDSRKIQRIGGEKSFDVDIRLIAATHRNLEKMVTEGTFREDLFYRLNVFPLSIPPLCERKRDIRILAEYFFAIYIKKLHPHKGIKLSRKAIRVLENYPWPGNVRQLRHTMERAILQSICDDTAEVSFDFLESAQEVAVLPHYSQEEIQLALEKTKGKVKGPSGAAALLGLHPATLYSRMKKIGINSK